ncbi:hypothetical protein ACH5RR_009169 [Cinchona calisaya]|uniref:Uncharacterized protein n=1 Tax=Cinchona calisaya TaxID=153742 RepID=A0ABD3AH39_9GENT
MLKVVKEVEKEHCCNHKHVLREGIFRDKKIRLQLERLKLKRFCIPNNQYAYFAGDKLQGVLTEATTELVTSLSVVAARRIVEADEFMMGGLYEGWIPHLYDNDSLHGKIL